MLSYMSAEICESQSADAVPRKGVSMPPKFDAKEFIRIPMEMLRARAGASSLVRRWDGVLIPQDEPQPPLTTTPRIAMICMTGRGTYGKNYSTIEEAMDEFVRDFLRGT